MRVYLEGLLCRAERKNSWHIAEAAEESRSYDMQRLGASASWDANEVRNDLWDSVVEHLADPAAVLVVDETWFLKMGTKSAGVARQYCGTAARIENCQIGVFLAYAASEAVALLYRELYLPKAWTEDRERRREAGIPDAVELATKPALAKEILERAVIFRVRHAWWRETNSMAWTGGSGVGSWRRASPLCWR